MTGPGIRVTVTEGPRQVDVDSVLDTIEELRSAGAEAMQVNGKVRLVAQSAVQSAPAGLEIDGTLLTSPYVFDVIGDPHTLKGALSLVDGPVAQFKDAGATVDVQRGEGARHHRRAQAGDVAVRPTQLKDPSAPTSGGVLPVACRASRAGTLRARTDPSEGEPCTPTT